MEVRAISKDTGISPRKVRPLVDMVRGKKVKSAAANAENNFQMDPADLKIVGIFADEARTTKRFRPRARGRSAPILKRSSHITVIVAEEESIGT